jgi:hypothetical protein
MRSHTASYIYSAKPIPPAKPKPKVYPRAMSIGVAIPCVDGIVIAADREVSRGGFSSYSQKVQRIALGQNPARYVVLAHAGLESDMLSVLDDLSDRIKGHDLMSEQLKEEFRDCIESQISTDSETVYQAIFAMPECEMWQAYANKAYPSSGTAAVIGVGDHSLARYLLEMLLPPSVQLGRPSRIDSCQAIIIASYVVQCVKKYVHGCGGETDIVWVPESGGWVSFGTGVLEGELARFESHIGVWFRAMARQNPNFHPMIAGAMTPVEEVLKKDREMEEFIVHVREMGAHLRDRATMTPPIRPSLLK